MWMSEDSKPNTQALHAKIHLQTSSVPAATILILIFYLNSYFWQFIQLTAKNKVLSNTKCLTRWLLNFILFAVVVQVMAWTTCWRTFLQTVPVLERDFPELLWSSQVDNHKTKWRATLKNCETMALRSSVWVRRSLMLSLKCLKCRIFVV